ncbi:MAG TPA: hypothetical protein VFD85_07275 [Gemmatimonadales bacterium]|nr:hypothetical protein [Gemmatimonadales bacterium]
MNNSRQQLAKSGLLADGGAPRCPHCRTRLSFTTDRQGRVLEACPCGYRAMVVTRRSVEPPAEPAVPPEPPR